MFVLWVRVSRYFVCWNPGQVVEMSKIKKILLRAYVTLLLASVLAVPGIAASTSSTISNAVGAGEGSSPLLEICYS